MKTFSNSPSPSVSRLLSDEQAPGTVRAGWSGIEQLGGAPCPCSDCDPDIEGGIPFQIELQAADCLAFGGKRDCRGDGLTGGTDLVRQRQDGGTRTCADEK